MENKTPSKKKGKGLPVRIKSKQIKEDLMYLKYIRIAFQDTLIYTADFHKTDQITLERKQKAS